MSKQGSQKKSRNVETVTELKAFEATYKAACRFHGVMPYKPILSVLQQCQDSSMACDKLFLASTAVNARITSAVAECLSSYAAVKSLCFYGCDIGNEGLSTVALLLRASAGMWWRGCKLCTLEICADGRQLPVTSPLPVPGVEAAPKPKPRTKAKASAEMQRAAQAAADGPTDAAVSTASASASAPVAEIPLVPTDRIGTPNGTAHHESAKALSSTANMNPSSNSDASKSSGTQGIQQLTKPLAGQLQASPTVAIEQQPPIAGVCPIVPQHLQMNFLNHMQLAQQAVYDRFATPGHIRYKSQPPRSLVEVKKGTLQALQEWKEEQEVLGIRQLADAAAQSNGVGKTVVQQQPQLPAVPQQHQQQQQQQQQQGQQIIQRTLPPVPGRLQSETCPRFSVTALQDLNLSLGVAGLGLVHLALDHTLLGDEGVAGLAAGIGKCSTLKRLSLCHCGFGAAGLRALAAALAPAAYGHAALIHRSSAAAGALRLATGSSGVPNADGNIISHDTGSTGTVTPSVQLQHLLLNGNSLAGLGLQALTPALRTMAALEVLGLADIGVTEVHKVQLQGLVHALTMGPSQLAQLDLDANFIGDRVASLFLALLSAKPSLILLKLTGRVSREVITQLTTLLQQNNKAAKPKKTKKRAK